MTMNKDKWLAAIIAGLVMGIPSAIPALGNCCILPAAVLAGLGAVFFYTRRTILSSQLMVLLSALLPESPAVCCARWKVSSPKAVLIA